MLTGSPHRLLILPYCRAPGRTKTQVSSQYQPLGVDGKCDLQQLQEMKGGSNYDSLKVNGGSSQDFLKVAI